jgi:hypothetical protein
MIARKRPVKHPGRRPPRHYPGAVYAPHSEMDPDERAAHFMQENECWADLAAWYIADECDLPWVLAPHRQPEVKKNG